MRGLKKQRRIQVIILALVCLVGATGLIGFALRDGINLFRSPTQVAEAAPAPGEVFRLGGLVAQGSIRKGEGVHF
ncbi:cytochrome c maturation protein CcmE, partial [Planktomarina sp.]